MLKEFLSIMEDDMNDSYMIYDYLKIAKETENDAMTQFFLNRAKQRLSNFKEDKIIIKDMSAKEEIEWDSLGKILLHNMEDKMCKLEYQISKLIDNK